MTLKAPERPCRQCGTTIPAQASGPGRPKEFCSPRCRRDWHYDAQVARERAEQREQWEKARHRLDVQHYGKREADRLARERAERRQ